MSGYTTIRPTRFVRIDNNGNDTADSSFGVVIYNDIDSDYCDSLPCDNIVGRTPAQIVKLVRGLSQRAAEIILDAEINDDGIFIGTTLHLWKDIRADGVENP